MSIHGNMKKFGSDPEGSKVNNLESSEAENRVKSAKFNDEGGEILEKKADPDLQGDKEWTPLFEETSNNPPQTKGKSDQSE